MTTIVPGFGELKQLDARLAEMESAARAVADDGEASFFCSNFHWLPMYTRLKGIIGVHRKIDDVPPSAPESGEALLDGPYGVLWSSEAFEVAYRYLSALLPPCRRCGCQLFDEVRESQFREMSGRESP